MTKIYLSLFVLSMLVFNKSYGQDVEYSDECVVKIVESHHEDSDCQADEIIETWCPSEDDHQMSLVSQCFTYYKMNEDSLDGYDSKVKCTYN